MSSAVLVTKLFVPTPRATLVPRAQLIQRLNEGLHRKLTLISAPAGFGKTTLLSEWANALERPVAWLSLDEGDNDPARFLTYLVAGLQTIAPTVGQDSLAAMQSAQPPAPESALVGLLNEVSALPDALVLVLDDYHAIDALAVDSALAFLLEHLPPQLHLVIATRQDPALPIARLRARGQLTELRAADLRFTAAEAAEYLNAVMGLRLSAAQIASLESRTEGWIAGLQLAALSMQGHEDAAGFIRGFAGDHRYIADYLVGEVLARQPEDVRSFLLQTAVLSRMNGPLCDALTGQESGSARLEALERGNFFVVPLDDKRHWYRYHHLFSEVLHTYLTEEQPDLVPILHRRASEWHERHGSPGDAIGHALAAEDFEHAADLVERTAPAMRRTRQETTLLAWLEALPDRIFQYRPVLSGTYAAALLAGGRLDDVEPRLRNAERWLPATSPGDLPPAEPPPGGMVVVDEDEFRRLPAALAVWRAGLALVQGNVSDTEKYARRALDLVPEDDRLQRGAAAALLGLAAWGKGDLDTAYRMYAEGTESLRRAGHISDVLGCSIALADIRITQGRLRDAMAIYESALRLGSEERGPVLRGTADMYVGMSELHREQGDLDAAARSLGKSQDLGASVGLPQHPYRWRVAMAHLRRAEGDLKDAVELLDEADRVYNNDFLPKVRPVAAMRTRVWLAQSRLSEASAWAQERGLSAEDELSYLREFEHITLARVLLAQYKGDRTHPSILRDALALLERLLRAAEQGRRTGHVIEILVLQALAHQAQGDIAAALVPLERAVGLAEPERYARIFLDEGPPMATLLQALARQGTAPNYVRQLLTGLRDGHDRTTPATQVLIEPLSDRELEVIRLLATELDGPDIARRLVVSLNTMRTHTKNIYSKLGVNNRREAVRRAQELELLSR
jgi:LuxR family maltose regulon positive regulatory protein